MRIIPALGLLMAIIFGVMMVPEFSALQDVGETLPGGLATWFGNFNAVAIVLVLIVTVGSAFAYVAVVFSRRF